jgi:acyl carrier protein
MDKEIIKNDLKGIFEEVFSTPNIEITETLNAELVDRWDSLTHLTMIAKVEEFYDIKFKLKELIGMKNVGDMMNLIISKKSA